MKRVKIGIMPEDQIRKRMLAIAKGEYTPKKSDPKVWFTSMKSMSEVLSDKNRALLRAIVETKPDSITVLASRTHREVSNVSRTLKTLERYGFVELHKVKRRTVPIVKATEFTIQAS